MELIQLFFPLTPLDMPVPQQLLKGKCFEQTKAEYKANVRNSNNTQLTTTNHLSVPNLSMTTCNNRVINIHKYSKIFNLFHLIASKSCKNQINFTKKIFDV